MFLVGSMFLVGVCVPHLFSFLYCGLVVFVLCLVCSGISVSSLPHGFSLMFICTVQQCKSTPLFDKID